MTRIVVMSCPECSGNVSVYEDEIGESGNCPNCGAVVEVHEDAVAAAGGGNGAGDLEEALGLDDDVAVEMAADDGLFDHHGIDDLDSDLLFDDEDLPVDHAEEGPGAPAEVVMEEADDESEDEEGSELVEAPVEHEPVSGPADYAVWQGVVQGAGDWAMAARLHALREAQGRGCLQSADPTDPGDVLARMVVAEAAVAAFQSEGEREWRREWTARLLQIARKWSDDATRDGVVAALARTDAVIQELKAAGLWPWG